MTTEEIERALASRLDADTTGAGRGSRSGPGHAPGRIDYLALVPATAGDAPSPPTGTKVSTRRSGARYVPSAYAVGAASLRARFDSKFWKALSRMRPDRCCGALFLGPSGCGKSSAAAYAVLRWLARVGCRTPSRAKPVVWLDAIEATDAERRYRLGSGDPEWLVEAYRAEWLVIDDIGVSTSPVLLQLVLARRYQAGLATIATTGLTREQLSEHIGAATVRRVLEFQGQKGLLVDCHGRNS